ncbi:hypothetical protein [Streptomyces sp. NPDC048392]|uniref:hypothetical protein n=1 Tax=Streptomyces sp. NPDC048392 TaxID=3365543 RepID=UPI00371CF9A7
MTTDTDLDAMLAQLPQRSTRECFAEIEAARRTEMARPPVRTIIPEPELPPLWPHPDSGTVRFRCALGPATCLWAYEHSIYDDDTEPLSVPLSADTGEIGRLLTERAERRSTELRARVEQAVRDHFAQAHPGQSIPERTV